MGEWIQVHGGLIERHLVTQHADDQITYHR